MMTLPTIFKAESLNGVILIICVLLSLVIANTSLNESFINLLQTSIGTGEIRLSLLNWINDGLMAIFFFFVGLEIKQEMMGGHLSSVKKASTPVLAAIGGALIPAIIFKILNAHTLTAKGWGIPMATDIAFALGVLSLLGKSVPSSLKAFLSTLAVVDDLIAILVIAIFYGAQLQWLNLSIALLIFSVLLLLNFCGVKRVIFYIVPGLFMWYFVHHSGVHATISGVLTAFAVPYKSDRTLPLHFLAQKLAAPVNFIIMPLFALANTNIHFSSGMIGGIGTPLGLGIIAGLLIGKPLGIMVASWLSVKLKIGQLPKGASWSLVLGIGLLAGIGFTMSIFMSFLSFGSSLMNAQSKFSIIVASLCAGCLGLIYLKKALKNLKKEI